MLQTTPSQLFFLRDIILNTPSVAEWGAIRQRKKQLIDKNNQVEKKYRKPHTYRIQDKVLVRNKKGKKYEETYVGPYPITQVYTNGNISIRQNAVQ